MMSTETNRRDFLKTTSIATSGLMMGVVLPGTVAETMAAGTLHTPNAWVHIADDNSITLISARSEMGQGVYTSMPMLIAEELNVDVTKVTVAAAPPGAVYANAFLGAMACGENGVELYERAEPPKPRSTPLSVGRRPERTPMRGVFRCC